MDLFTINQIRSNPNLYSYLRENSTWYKYLNRNRANLKSLDEEMKKKYKLTPEDKIEKFSRSIDLISTFMDVLN